MLANELPLSIKEFFDTLGIACEYGFKYKAEEVDF